MGKPYTVEVSQGHAYVIRWSLPASLPASSLTPLGYLTMCAVDGRPDHEAGRHPQARGAQSTQFTQVRGIMMSCICLVGTCDVSHQYLNAAPLLSDPNCGSDQACRCRKVPVPRCHGESGQ